MKLGLIYGGTSSERDVSTDSANSIYDTIKLEFDIVKIKFNGDQDYLLSQIKDNKIDLVINALHGGVGEDGTLQKLFEVNNIKFSGSGSKSSKIAMDKNQTKKRQHDNMPRCDISKKSNH